MIDGRSGPIIVNVTIYTTVHRMRESTTRAQSYRLAYISWLTNDLRLPNGIERFEGRVTPDYFVSASGSTDRSGSAVEYVEQ